MMMPRMVTDWLVEFQKSCSTEGPTTIAHKFVMMGPCNPESCDCYNPKSDEVERWLHTHHREWNHTLWLCLKHHGKLYAVRQVIKRDQQREDRQIVSRGYAQGMLDGLLNSKPSWI